MELTKQDLLITAGLSIIVLISIFLQFLPSWVSIIFYIVLGILGIGMILYVIKTIIQLKGKK